MAKLIQNQITDIDTTDSSWKSLFKIAGAAVLIAPYCLCCWIS